MTRTIPSFSRKKYDLLVIGGGINGAAVAHLAALNGLKTALLEKGDFASGASSKSTKLLHGGLRYLEHFEFGLIREALRERSLHLAIAPHLAKPLEFIIPVYQQDRRPLWMMRLGVTLYDWLSGRYLIKPHRTLSVQDVIEKIPDINKDGLKGGVMYSDAQMDDARLCLENVLRAQELGADVANYFHVKDLIKENGKAVGVSAWDVLGKTAIEVRAKTIICTVGPWTNILMHKEHSQSPAKIRTTKGAHVVYNGRFCEHALFLQTRQDGRMFFAIPFQGNTLIGTTDTDFEGSPDKVDTDKEDIQYLIAETRRFFPDKDVSEKHIISTFAGLRPLVYNEGAPSKVSRRHCVERSYSGVYYLFGGKYTTYRVMAEDVLTKACGRSFADKRFELFALSAKANEAAFSGDGVSPGLLQHLKDFYGRRAIEVIALIKSDPELSSAICSCSLTVKAQIVHAIEREMACGEEDMVLRRFSLNYLPCSSRNCRAYIQQAIAARL